MVVSARNEQVSIARCLTSVRWADEIILVDNESSDDTVSTARRFTRKIYRQPNHTMLNLNKNYGFSKASGDWILSFDADEECTQALAEEIRHVIEYMEKTAKARHPIVGYWIPRKNIIFGKWIQHGLWWPDKQLRLFRRGKGVFPCVHVHEYIEVEGQTESLNEPYLHYNYSSISQFIQKMDTIYTADEVKNLLASKYRISWYDAVRFPLSDFVKIYFAQEGYRDGMHGLVLSMLQAFYSFTVFAKLWESEKFPQREVNLSHVDDEFDRSLKVYRYWRLTVQLHSSRNPLMRLWFRLVRKYGFAS